MLMNRYHSFLRIGLLISAFLLVCTSGFVSPITAEISKNTIAYIGSVGSSVLASVPPNEINTLSAQLSERGRELDARESALREREIQARSYETESSGDYSTYILSVIVFILSVLLVINFVMDTRRIRNFSYEKQLG